MNEPRSQRYFDPRHSLPPQSKTIPEKPGFAFRARTWVRFLLIALTLLCLTSLWSNILAFNFVMVCLSSAENSTHGSPHAHVPLFSTEQRTYLTSVVAISALISNFIILPLLTTMGVRTIFTVCGGISAISTAFMPLGIMTGFYATLLLRCLQGIAFSASFPGTFSLSFVNKSLWLLQ